MWPYPWVQGMHWCWALTSPLLLQTRSSRHSQGSQPGLADQAKLSFASAESLETMSEAELPLGFNRMNRFRQSLPLSRSTSQTKLRSPGTPALPQPYCIRALGNATPAHSAALLLASMCWGVQSMPVVQHCFLHPCIGKCNPCPWCSIASCIHALGNATPAHGAALLIASMRCEMQPLPTVQHHTKDV